MTEPKPSESLSMADDLRARLGKRLDRNASEDRHYRRRWLEIRDLLLARNPDLSGPSLHVETDLRFWRELRDRADKGIDPHSAQDRHYRARREELASRALVKEPMPSLVRDIMSRPQIAPPPGAAVAQWKDQASRLPALAKTVSDQTKGAVKGTPSEEPGIAGFLSSLAATTQVVADWIVKSDLDRKAPWLKPLGAITSLIDLFHHPEKFWGTEEEANKAAAQNLGIWKSVFGAVNPLFVPLLGRFEDRAKRSLKLAYRASKVTDLVSNLATVVAVAFAASIPAVPLYLSTMPPLWPLVPHITSFLAGAASASTLVAELASLATYALNPSKLLEDFQAVVKGVTGVAAWAGRTVKNGVVSGARAIGNAYETAKTWGKEKVENAYRTPLAQSFADFIEKTAVPFADCYSTAASAIGLSLLPLGLGLAAFPPTAPAVPYIYVASRVLSGLGHALDIAKFAMEAWHLNYVTTLGQISPEEFKRRRKGLGADAAVMGIQALLGKMLGAGKGKDPSTAKGILGKLKSSFHNFLQEGRQFAKTGKLTTETKLDIVFSTLGLVQKALENIDRILAIAEAAGKFVKETAQRAWDGTKAVGRSIWGGVTGAAKFVKAKAIQGVTSVGNLAKELATPWGPAEYMAEENGRRTKIVDGSLTGPFASEDDPAKYGDPEAAIGQGATVFVNGILTDYDGHRSAARLFAKRGRPVVGVYVASTVGKGKVHSGILGAYKKAVAGLRDVVDAGAIAYGRVASPAVLTLQRLIEKYGKPSAKNGGLNIVAHSKGSIVLAEALWRANRNIELTAKKIHVKTIGNAAFSYPEGPRYRHDAHDDDFVTNVFGVNSPGAQWYFKSPAAKFLRAVTGEFGRGGKADDALKHTRVRTHGGSGFDPHNADAYKKAENKFDATRPGKKPESPWWHKTASVAAVPLGLLTGAIARAAQAIKKRVQRQGEGPEPEEDGPSIREGILRREGRGFQPSHFIRHRLRAQLGFDPGGARFHTGPVSAAVSRRLRAEAFTVGRDVFFGEGRFDPLSPRGLGLIAHELTHVGQQAGLGSSKGRFQSVDGDEMEREAQEAAARVHATVPASGLLVDEFVRQYILTEGAGAEKMSLRLDAIAAQVMERVEREFAHVVGGELERVEVDIQLDLERMSDEEAVERWTQEVVSRLRPLVRSSGALPGATMPRVQQSEIPDQPEVRAYRETHEDGIPMLQGETFPASIDAFAPVVAKVATTLWRERSPAARAIASITDTPHRTWAGAMR